MRYQSQKPIKTFDECFDKFTCTFSPGSQNEVDPKTRLPAVYVSINKDTVYFPIGVPVKLEYPQWVLLRSINFPNLPRYDYDPIRKNGWYPY